MTDVDHKRLAKELDRRRMKRRLAVLAGLLGAAIAAAMYLRCGKGWGTGGAGEGDGKGVATVPAVRDATLRCQIRLAATGLTVDGKPATKDEAIAACKQTTGADVLITGDARQGDWDDLRAALEAAGVTFFTREPRGVTPSDAAEAPIDANAPSD